MTEALKYQTEKIANIQPGDPRKEKKSFDAESLTGLKSSKQNEPQLIRS